MMEPSDEENQVAVAPGVAEINHNDDNEETKEKQEEKNDNETTSPFPISFYCSITGKLMVDPVVHPNGDSYERSAIMEQDSTLLYYPNRALKAYIEQGLERFQRTGSMRGLLQNWNDSMRSGWQKLLDKSALPSGEYRPLPDSFYCPITFDLIHEPAIDPDGYTYEKDAIVQWINANGDSPVTRKALTVDKLYDNNALLNIMLEATKGGAETMHPSIRKWKQEQSARQAARATAPTDVEVMAGNNPMSPSRTTQASDWATRDELQRRRDEREHNCTFWGMILVFVITAIFFPSFALWAMLLFFTIVTFFFAKCRPNRAEPSNSDDDA